jgi:hypothetical protein
VEAKFTILPPSGINFRHPHVTKFRRHAIEDTPDVDSKDSLVVFRIVISHIPQFSGYSSAVHCTCILSILSLPDMPACTASIYFLPFQTHYQAVDRTFQPCHVCMHLPTRDYTHQVAFQVASAPLSVKFLPVVALLLHPCRPA